MRKKIAIFCLAVVRSFLYENDLLETVEDELLQDIENTVKTGKTYVGRMFEKEIKR